MKNIVLTLFLTGLLMSGFAQEDEPLGQKIDDITYDWDQKAEGLKNYEGLSKFCVSVDYRNEIITLLEGIHHYDSVLYQRLSKVARHSDDHEVKQTLKDIEKFEEGYSIKAFLHFLHEECDRRKDIEHHAQELKNDIGADSYDGQVYLVETELNKFIKQVTKRVDNIRNHVHHLHLN